jgi:hypothetical protein
VFSAVPDAVPVVEPEPEPSPGDSVLAAAKSLLPGSLAMICGVPVPGTVGPVVTAPVAAAEADALDEPPGTQPLEPLGAVP